MQVLSAGEGEGRELHAGIIRDQLFNRVPVMLRKDIYASTALLGGCIAVSSVALEWSRVWLTWLAMLLCFTSRMCRCATAGICA